MTAVRMLAIESFRCTSFTFCACWVCLLAGCDKIPPRPPIGVNPHLQIRTFSEPADSGTEEPEASVDPIDMEAEPASSIAVINSERWDACFNAGKHVGFRHTRVKPLDEQEDYVRYSVEEQLQLPHSGHTVRQWLQQTCIESVNGQLQEFDSQRARDGDVILTDGKMRYNQLDIAIQRSDGKSTRAVDWKPVYRGLFAIEQSLLANPLQPGASRTLRCLLPLRYEIGTVKLQATQRLNVAMLDGSSRRLLEIECTVSVQNREVLSRVLWADDKGEIQKSFTEAIDFTTFKTDERTATAVATPNHDLLVATSIPVTAPADFDPLDERKSLTFLIQHRSLNPASIIPAISGQQVTPVDERSARVTCTIGEEHLPNTESFNERDELSNEIIQSDHPTIMQMSNSLLLTKDATTQQKIEVLRQAVNQHLIRKNFTRDFLTAAQVATEGEGDSTEYAILLAALCRAAKIPARVAAGMLLQPASDGPQPRMTYHMWTLVWTGDRWQAVDATRLEPASYPDRITLVTADLSTNDPFPCFMPVIRAMGHMQIKIVEATE